MALDPNRTKPEIDFPEGEPPADLVIEDVIEGDGREEMGRQQKHGGRQHIDERARADSDPAI